MKTLSTLTNELLVKSEERLAKAIIGHQKTLSRSFEGICKDLLGTDPGNYSLVQKFQGISTLDRTLDVMLAFYRASYGREFNESDWVKEETPEPTLTSVLNRLADKLDSKELPK